MIMVIVYIENGENARHIQFLNGMDKANRSRDMQWSIKLFIWLRNIIIARIYKWWLGDMV